MTLRDHKSTRSDHLPGQSIKRTPQGALSVGSMSLIFSSVVDAPLDEVFGWHARPGAIHRLSPPWQPVGVVSEASTLDGGRAVLGLPLGLRWGARHTGFEPPHRFVDELDSAPLSWALKWRHTHEFAAE